MAGIDICEPTELYNIITRMESVSKPSVVDSNYLLLLDTRPRDSYDKSHISVARFAVKVNDEDFTVPGVGVEVPTLRHIIVYDSNTVSVVENTPAVKCARMLATKGNRCTVKVLKGGFERFSAEYPFLRTQKIIYTTLELEKLPRYPTELLPLSLYLGDHSHAYNAALNYNMKISAHVNMAAELYPAYPGTIATLHVESEDRGEENLLDRFEDRGEENLLDRFEDVCDFIDKHIGSSQRVLVFGELGISRSATVCIAYLMKHNKWGLKEAYAHVCDRRPQICPLSSFVQQLSKWEVQIFGEKLTDITKPRF